VNWLDYSARCVWIKLIVAPQLGLAMNLNEEKYSRFHLCKEMLETAKLVKDFNPSAQQNIATTIADVGQLLMTGEGSSRIFPAKNTIQFARQKGSSLVLHTEAGRQSQDYDLSKWAVFAASNSGQTAEVIGLFKQLNESGHAHRYSLSAKSDSTLESLANQGFRLSCGKEDAVAATKSVVEQGLFYRSVIEHTLGDSTLATRLTELGDAIEAALRVDIDPQITQRIANAGTIYWSGRNDGVAEELTLKTNEITRKKSDFMEGTYAVHGIEEVMDATDVVLWIDPFEESEDKFRDVLCDTERENSVGLDIIAISSRQTSFPTITIPDCGDLAEFVQLAAGWNVLVEVGLSLDINLDEPQRARKVGNDIDG
jgi:glucosamine--fructose-6-phosphate aminotransferase (isomerizing)